MPKARELGSRAFGQPPRRLSVTLLAPVKDRGRWHVREGGGADPPPVQAVRCHSSCAVGRNRISLMSTSSGWLMAKATTRAKLSAGMA